MLTETDLATMRANVASWKRRAIAGPVARVTFDDGPLAGVETLLPASATRAAYVAGVVLTQTGVVQALYRPMAADPHRLAF